MAKTTFQGPVKSINGFQSVGTGNSVSIGAGATSLTVDTHAGRMLYHNVAGAATLTLPAINSSSCLLYTSPSPRDRPLSRMPSSA